MPDPGVIVCTFAGILTLGVAGGIGAVYLFFDKNTPAHLNIRVLAGKILLAFIFIILFGTISLVSVLQLFGFSTI